MPKNKVISWNVNSSPQIDPRADGKTDPRYEAIAQAFKECSVEARLPLIKARLDQFRDKNYSVFALQEINNSALPKLSAHLESKGLQVLTQKYNPDISAFNFIFSFDSKKYKLIEAKAMYLTLSGEPTNNRAELTKEELFKQNLDTAFEKSCQVVVLEELESNQVFVFVNTHLGLSNKHRLLASEMICQKLSSVKDPIVLLGDFNQFDSTYNEPVLYEEQIEIYKRNGYVWNGESLHFTEPRSTFAGFLYDYERYLNVEEKSKLEKLKVESNYAGIREFFVDIIKSKKISILGIVMDGFFTKNFSMVNKCQFQVRCKALLFSNGERVKPVPSRKEVEQKTFEALVRGEPDASDHYPIACTIKY